MKWNEEQKSTWNERKGSEKVSEWEKFGYFSVLCSLSHTSLSLSSSFFFFFLGFGFCFLGFLLGFGYGEEEARVWNVKENSGSIESIYITEPHFKLFGLSFELISPSTTFTFEWNWNCFFFFFNKVRTVRLQLLLIFVVLQKF